MKRSLSLDAPDNKRRRCDQAKSNVNGAIFYGSTLNGLKHGRCITYSNGFPSIVADYENGKLHGSFEMFDVYRRKICQGRMNCIKIGDMDRYIFNGSYFYFEHDDDFVPSQILLDLFQEEPAQIPSMIYTGRMSGNTLQTLNPCGYGTQTKYGTVLYRGHFLNGMYHGRGKKYDGNLLKYDGNYVNGILQGPGRKHLSSFEVIEGFFLDGILHGPGTQYYKKTIKFEGIFLMGQYERGRLYLTNKQYFEGCFHGGTKSRGKVIEDNIVLFDGTFGPDGLKIGRGRQRLSDTLEMNCIFENNTPYGYVEINRTNVSDSDSSDSESEVSKDLKMCGTVLRTFGESNEYIELTDAKLYHDNSVKKFEGSTYFDRNGSIHMLSGLYYVNGVKRIKGNFADNDFTELYDENGILMMKSTTLDYEMSHLVNTWPTYIEGYWQIFDENGQYMYGADFYDCQMLDPLKVARKLPVFKLKGLQPDDIITMDKIETGKIFYFLNQNPEFFLNDLNGACTKHVVSLETLKIMKKKKALKSHPLTRMPIVRIRRAVVE
jgi:hypothetical protein